MGHIYQPMNQIPDMDDYGPQDYLVLFGELFQRGYANGLVEAAQKRGMKIIYSTVGRRDGLSLRPLKQEEIQVPESDLINIPLEAGFDMEASHNQGPCPVDQLKELKLSDWESAQLNWSQIEESRKNGESRFRNNLNLWTQELKKRINPKSKIVIAHLMAGGVPRAKIVMPLMNRAFKGSGDRYLSSEVFWNSEIGRLCQLSFQEVTAKTLDHLISATTEIRNEVTKAGGRVSFTAYGYHGTAVQIQEKFQWQTYSPYLQGWAKKSLEDIAEKYHRQGVAVCVYNCPEILTNSSSIFQGVEIPLYPLYFSLEKKCSQNTNVKETLKDCVAKLKDPEAIFEVKKICELVLTHPKVKEKMIFEKWPQHSSKEQLELILKHSDELYSLHKSEKDLMTSPLSELVFESCGEIMLRDSKKPSLPYTWINHDIITEHFARN